jgi:hypothetical protein
LICFSISKVKVHCRGGGIFNCEHFSRVAVKPTVFDVD